MRAKRMGFVGGLVLLLAGGAAHAQEPGMSAAAINAGDTAWVLISTALVMFMTPGLAFFYGGLVRRKNVLSILMQCFMILCLISIQWVLFGYSLSFGPDRGGFIGGLDHVGLKGIGIAPLPYAPTIPGYAFVMFQMMFAVITPGLIIGAFAERMRFSAFCVFSLLWATVVYDPVCHWVWGGGGFLGLAPGRMGTLDFAGGIVVHITAGMSALAAALLLGRRLGFPNKMSPPHNLPVAVLGAAMLWFGWFGFNAGSALQANGIAATTFLVTHVSGAMAGLIWALLDWRFTKRPTMLGVITGAVAGLAAVTPASGYVGVGGALGIGAVSGALCWVLVMQIKNRLGYDDTLDAFGVHGVGGIWGTLAVGLWASRALNPAAPHDGWLLGGGAAQFLVQLKAVLITGVYSFIASYVLFRLVDLALKIRVDEHEERIGLDLTQHKETGYTVID